MRLTATFWPAISGLSVVKDIREGKDEVIDELVLTLQKLMK